MMKDRTNKSVAYMQTKSPMISSTETALGSDIRCPCSPKVDKASKQRDAFMGELMIRY